MCSWTQAVFVCAVPIGLTIGLQLYCSICMRLQFVSVYCYLVWMSGGACTLLCVLARYASRATVLHSETGQSWLQSTGLASTVLCHATMAATGISSG